MQTKQSTQYHVVVCTCIYFTYSSICICSQSDMLVGSIVDAILDFCVTEGVNINLYAINVFLTPKDIGIDTLIVNFELIFIELYSFRGFGGHLERHLENGKFPEV